MTGVWACEHKEQARTKYGVVGVGLLCASFDFFASLENFELDCFTRQSYHAHIVGLFKDYYARHSKRLNKRLHSRYKERGMKPHDQWTVAPSAPWGTKGTFAPVIRSLLGQDGGACDEGGPERESDTGQPRARTDSGWAETNDAMGEQPHF